jgi:thiol-disulfide isomerase/thioredoxin
VTGGPGRGATIAGWAVVALLLLSLGLNVQLMAASWSSIRPLSTGKSAPGFNLEAADGKRISLAALRGKVVLVAFWASWCEPCMREMPLLGRLQRELGSEGLVVLAVNVEAERDKLGVVAEKGGKGVTVLLDEGQAAGAYGVQTLPHLVLVGREGQVAYIHVGAGREQKLEGKVRKALGLPPKEPTGKR